MKSEYSLGQKIKSYRKRAGITQFDLELMIDAAFGSICRLETDKVNPTKETLHRLAKVLDLSVTEKADLFGMNLHYLSRILNPYHIIFNESIAHQLWTLGSIKELNSILEKQYCDGNKSQMLGLAHTYLELGKIAEATNLIQEIKTTNNDILVSGYLKLIESEILVLQDDLDTAQTYLSNGVLEFKEYKDSYILGKMYFLLGLINSQRREIFKGNDNMQKSLEYFDVIRYPLEVGKVYLFMTDFLEYAEDYKKAECFYERARELFEDNGNMYLQSWSLGGEAFNKYIQGSYNDAIKLATKACSMTKYMGTTKQEYYSASVLAKSVLVKGHHAQAYSLFNKALSLENTFRQRTDASSSNLYKLLIKAQENKDSIRNMEEILKDNCVTDPTKIYLLHTAKYLYGQPGEKVEGEKGLRKLKATIKLNHLSNAITKTLEKKCIQPLTT